MQNDAGYCVSSELVIRQIPVLNDNYVYLIVSEDDKQGVIVDAPVAESVVEFLEKNQITPVAIWNTHHHWDHVGANEELVQRYKIPVYCSVYDFKNARVPCATHKLKEGDVVTLAGHEFQILEIPGHTLGHIAYAGEGMVFCGDTLFAAGCGRLFEGTPRQMFDSLAKLKSLPPQTFVYCAHEYTLNNLKFALSVEPDNLHVQRKLNEVIQLRESGQSTVPTTLADELLYNPFLRAGDVQEFASRRELKDRF